MGRKERLLEYSRKLSGMYHRAYTASESGVHSDPADDRYYEDLVNGLVPARTKYNKMIQALTKRDAGLTLAIIGMDHPAAKVVYRYLVQQKCVQCGERASYLLKMNHKRNLNESAWQAADWELITKEEQEVILRCQAKKEDVEEALRKTRKLQRIVREYKSSVPAQDEKSAIELVLERATGKVHHGKNTTSETNTSARRKFVPQGNPYHALCKKLEREFKKDTGTFPAG